MLDIVAAASAALADQPVTGVRPRLSGAVQQFSLAAVARTALAEAMTYRDDQPVPTKALERMCELAIQVDQPDIPESGILDAAVMRRLFGRLTYQQFVFGHAELEDVTRTLALFDDHDPTLTDMPTATQWEDALGVPLPVYLNIAFTSFVGLAKHAGQFPHAAIAAAAAVGAFGVGVDAATATSVIEKHFSTDQLDLETSAKASEAGVGGHELWVSNPLLGRPMIRRPDGYLAPVVPYMLNKVTPLGMYFTGVQVFGNRFPQLVGNSFEKLVGRHLQLLAPLGAQIHPEVTYGHENKRTCDWIVVLASMVLLVECKGMRSLESARLGQEEGLQTLATRVQKAREQIATTATLITGCIPELAHIPHDRPIRGLVVTLEPIHNVDTYIYDDLLMPTAIQTATASAHSLEEILPTLAVMADGQERFLAALTASPPTPAGLERAVKGVDRVRNPISLKLWDDWHAGAALRTPER
ncbi:hypothetical protein ACWDYH_36365 [Nocardia goodfellowii]